jgi:methyl-accepting chemotaxis protein
VVSELAEEMGNWRDNMSGTNLEATDKYSRVEEAADSLENVVSAIDDIDTTPQPCEKDTPEDFAQTLEEIADALDEAVSELEGVDFPGMYG